MLGSLIENFTDIKSIPINLLVEPMLKANREENKYIYESFDYDFLSFVSQHHKLSEKIAVFIADQMSKIILNNSSNTKAASVVIKSLLYRYINKNEMQEFVIRFLDKSCKFYISSFNPATFELTQSDQEAAAF